MFLLVCLLWLFLSTVAFGCGASANYVNNKKKYHIHNVMHTRTLLYKDYHELYSNLTVLISSPYGVVIVGLKV